MRDVVPDGSPPLEHDPARHGLLESLQVHGDRIPAEDQRRTSCTRRRRSSTRTVSTPVASLWMVTVAPGTRGALRVGDDAADDGPVGTLGEERARGEQQRQLGDSDSSSEARRRLLDMVTLRTWV